MSDQEAQEEGGSSKMVNDNPAPDGVQQVFSMFKSYLEERFEQKGKEFEHKTKTEKDIVQLKFKGNQKQFELNAQLDSILDEIQAESLKPRPITRIQKLVEQGKELIRRRQKLIKIADRNKDGWKVVEEYESDDLASGSEDEKRLKKAKDSANRKRRQQDTQAKASNKRLRTNVVDSDNQLFRGMYLNVN